LPRPCSSPAAPSMWPSRATAPSGLGAPMARASWATVPPPTATSLSGSWWTCTATR